MAGRIPTTCTVAAVVTIAASYAGWPTPAHAQNPSVTINVDVNANRRRQQQVHVRRDERGRRRAKPGRDLRLCGAADVGAVTLMVISTQLSGRTPATINVANFPHRGTAEAWQLTSANAIARLADAPLAGK